MSDTTITVYSKKSCVQCDATLRKLREFKVEHVIEDATDLENLEFIADVLGYSQAPVVTVHVDGELVNHWSGYQPGELDKFK